MIIENHKPATHYYGYHLPNWPIIPSLRCFVEQWVMSNFNGSILFNPFTGLGNRKGYQTLCKLALYAGMLSLQLKKAKIFFTLSSHPQDRHVFLGDITKPFLGLILLTQTTGINCHFTWYSSPSTESPRFKFLPPPLSHVNKIVAHDKMTLHYVHASSPEGICERACSRYNKITPRPSQNNLAFQNQLGQYSFLLWGSHGFTEGLESSVELELLVIYLFIFDRKFLFSNYYYFLIRSVVIFNIDCPIKGLSTVSQ